MTTDTNHSDTDPRQGVVTTCLEDEEGEEPEPGGQVTGHPEGGGAGGGGAELEAGLLEEVLKVGEAGKGMEGGLRNV